MDQQNGFHLVKVSSLGKGLRSPTSSMTLATRIGLGYSQLERSAGFLLGILGCRAASLVGQWESLERL